ncbi:MAG: Gfo/Idh/MocA family oxidoreductase [Kordiimonadaceae bacterium]|nr:Gfo/Idh/MocA family oxidoreductase [Kordiimonadaceae bacterium]MBO6570666.1 Gfo/Idh/MocA family oxidoreductase [Kordiimonadaceae bacterium]MBO6966476.1 Gfo/Idh/MocA family oxidoreductase [Kordiimonadaceae bacterium]
MRILIVGSGSYVLGDLYGPGVILRSVVQWLLTETDTAEHNISISYNSSGMLGKKQAAIDAVFSQMGAGSRVTYDLVSSSEAEQIIKSKETDACFISVPDKHHAHYIKAGMEQNVPVWVVKPLTGDDTHSKELVAIQRRTGARVWVDYHKRFDVSNRLLKKQVEDQELGRLLAYSVDYHQPRTLPIDVFDWTADVGVFTYIGCHYVDQVFYLFPEAKLVSVSAEPLKGEVFAKTGQFDGVLATLAFETLGGTIVCPMNVGWFNPKGAPTKSLQTLKVQFERGLVELDQTRRGVHIWHDDGVSEINPYFFCAAPDAFGQTKFSGYGYDSVKYFLEIVHTRGAWPTQQNLPSLQEAAKTDFVVSAVQNALRSGEKIVFD